LNAEFAEHAEKSGDVSLRSQRSLRSIGFHDLLRPAAVTGDDVAAKIIEEAR